MEIKNYLKFINESKDSNKEKIIWKLTEYDINDYMREFLDEGYIVDVEYGFSQENLNNVQQNDGEDEFITKVESGEDVLPAYWIRLIRSSKMSNNDLTDTLKFAYDIISEQSDSNISLLDGSYNPVSVNIDSVLIKDGLFDNLSEMKHLSLFVKQKETVKFNEMDLMKYYNWDVDEIKDGKLYTYMSLKYMVDIFLARKSHLRDILLNKEEIYDNYYGGDYQPDLNSLFSYDLNTKNSEDVVNILIGENGGIEEFIENFDIEREFINKSDQLEHLKSSEKEFINYLLGDGFSILSDACEDNEMIEGILQTCGDFSMDAHLDANYRELVSAFDDVIEKEGLEFEKKVEDGETTYVLHYDNMWIEEFEGEDIHDHHLEDVFKNWCYSQHFGITLNPRFSDYGYVDKKELNIEIESIIRYRL